MNHKARGGKLEDKCSPRQVFAIELEKDEAEDQAKQRYCAANGMTVNQLDAQSSLTVFLVTEFGE